MIAAPPRRRRGMGDAGLALKQLRYEQLAFWRNPVGAAFTVAFPIVLFLLLAGSTTKQQSSVLHGPYLQYYLAAFTSFGVMSASFTNLSLTIVQRRETGQLKRLRLSPLPVPALVGGLFLNVLLIVVLQLVAILALGRFAYGGQLPTNWGALLVAVAFGVLCFVSLGVGVSSLVPNAEAGGPVVNIIFFVAVFISGIWFPIAPSSGLAKIATYLPIRHFVLAVYAPLDHTTDATPWAWPDLRALVIWTVIGVFLAVRRFSFEPRRH